MTAVKRQPPNHPNSDSHGDLVQRTLIVIGLVTATLLLLLAAWFAIEVFLLLFAAILLAVLLRLPTDWMASHTLLSQGAALAIVGLLLAGFIGLSVWLFAGPIAEQIAQLVETLPDAFTQLLEHIERFHWGGPLLALIERVWGASLNLDVLSHATGLISSTVNAVIGVVVTLFLGFYLAAQPRIYVHGFVRLLPPSAHPLALKMLHRIGRVMKWWLLGRLFTMTLVGVTAGVGLWWLDIPLAFALGLLSGLFEFIPYIGPFVASIPALLIAFNVDPAHALYVLILFAAIQMAENYLISPLVEQRTVSIPPALVIFSTLLLGVLFGGLGVALASPLTAVCLIAVRVLYVEKINDSQSAKSTDKVQ